MQCIDPEGPTLLLCSIGPIATLLALAGSACRELEIGLFLGGEPQIGTLGLCTDDSDGRREKEACCRRRHF